MYSSDLTNDIHAKLPIHLNWYIQEAHRAGEVGYVDVLPFIRS